MPDLTSVHRAQERVVHILVSAEVAKPLIRLTRCDLLETSLVKALAVIQEAPRYLRLPSAALRDHFTALHLEMAIIGWLRERTDDSVEVAALASAEQNILSTTR